MAYIRGILLGRITKASGYEGAITVKLEKNISDKISEMESVFLEVEGRLVPFIISDYEYPGADLLKLRFEGYDSIEKISEFTGSRVFLTSGCSTQNQADEIHTLKGYEVLLQDGNVLGVVTDIILNPGQWLLNIISEKNKDVLIPFHEDLIVSINKRKKIIIMDIPEGLTEIN